MLRYFPGVVVENTDQNLLTFLLVVVCTPYYINNPYLGERVRPRHLRMKNRDKKKHETSFFPNKKSHFSALNGR